MSDGLEEKYQASKKTTQGSRRPAESEGSVCLGRLGTVFVNLGGFTRTPGAGWKISELLQMGEEYI